MGTGLVVRRNSMVEVAGGGAEGGGTITGEETIEGTIEGTIGGAESTGEMIGGTESTGEMTGGIETTAEMTPGGGSIGGIGMIAAVGTVGIDRVMTRPSAARESPSGTRILATVDTCLCKRCPCRP
jgi:hypothetical protein